MNNNLQKIVDEVTKEVFERLYLEHPHLRKLPKDQFSAIFQAGVTAGCEASARANFGMAGSIYAGSHTK
jgi:hypothetical protein